MDSLPIYEIPWDLVAASLQHELLPEEALQLAQWLSADKAHQEKYDQLLRLWNNGLAEFTAYQSANENEAWLALQKRIAENENALQKEVPVITGRFGWLSGMKTRIAVAAIFIFVIGTLYWYRGSVAEELIYETAANEQKTVTLPDGSTLLLQPSSEIRLANGYNKQNRTMALVKGNVFFNVPHQPALPFIVNMGTSAVRDIGTRFSIYRTPDSIKVAVTSGKVAFLKTDTQESRELGAGMAVSLTTATLQFSEIESIPVSATDSSNPLNFDNLPLSEVIEVIQKVYDKRIELSNIQMGQKKFKANLYGLSFNRAMQIICTTQNLSYAEKNGVYILKEK